MSKTEPRKVPCPSCGKAALFAPENRFRPFCSERCKTQDLGAWASESYRVPAQTPPDDQSLEDVRFQ